MELPKIPRHWSLMQSAAKETSHTNSHMSQHTVMLSFFSPGWGKLVIGAMIPVAACRTRKNWTLRILHPFKRPATGKSIKFLRSHPFNFGMLKIGLRQPSLAHEDGVTWATCRWPSTPYDREDDDWTVARPEPQIFPYQRWSPNYRKFASFWGRKTNPFFQEPNQQNPPEDLRKIHWLKKSWHFASIHEGPPAQYGSWIGKSPSTPTAKAWFQYWIFKSICGPWLVL